MGRALDRTVRATHPLAVALGKSAAILLLVLGGAACTWQGSGRATRAGNAMAPNVVRVPNGESDEKIVGLPRGALTSEASLLTLDQSGACFDVLVRTWTGAGPSWDVHVEVDDVETSSFKWTPRVCAPSASCLPPGAYLRGLTSDADDRVLVRGGRLCVRAPNGDAARSIDLHLRQGAAEIVFAFRIAE